MKVGDTVRLRTNLRMVGVVNRIKPTARGLYISLTKSNGMPGHWRDAGKYEVVPHPIAPSAPTPSKKSSKPMSSTHSKLLGDIDCSYKGNTEWSREYGLQVGLPEIPEDSCTCETRVVVNFGCKCDAGKKELAKERAS